MSIKEKLTSILFSQKSDKTPAEAEQERTGPVVEKAPEFSGGSVSNPALLEIPAEHPLNQLYNHRRHEAGYLPAPRICLDEDGALPPDVVQKEKARLRTVLTGACSARLREAKGQNKKKGPKDPKAQSAKAHPEKKGGHKEQKTEPEASPPCLDALPCFFVSADKLYAWVMVFPPVGKGAELSRDMLYQALSAQGITFGVDTRLADHLSHSEKRYFHLYLIARGKPAFDGKNGNIVDNFPRVIERVLEVDEFDQVDYTALNLIHNVEEGQEICRLIKPTEGEPGRTVLDQEIPAKSGTSVPLPKGRNTEISEDETQLLATISGSVEFTGRSFQVNPVLDIPGDVDFSTGNLNFMGDINIQGNVISGFTVRAMGNIHIAGVIEAGSTVEAGGDLAVVKGILGDGSTTVQVHRNIFSKYVENATICVRENLQTDCIIGSNIYCGGEVIVRSGRGSIMGGRVWAAMKVNANVVGSPSECKTSIILGGKPCASFEWEITQKEVNRLEMELEKLECQIDSPAKSSLLSKTKIKLAIAKLKLQQMEDPLESAAKEREQKQELRPGKREKKDPGRLECSIAYPGTKLRFGEEVLRLHQISRQCIATLVEGEIVLM
ncbi:DUF342 domain-containing protein [Pseudoflavonifractor sp. 524-17]|uniref:DUF342 domain-containing protein n=1 Tax=Pseudoflavonifractor sp. 524-17 TaxID=2304577 RepID=UPI00137B8628|nr:FapA family protein [Pseudoflavonifractor sp. 524-17]NCE63606.1 DUF342 domain-containing protein [Pseudoflavonifractor sp. 524-17]